MKSAAVPVVATKGHQITVQVETVVFWDLVPLLQPRPQSFTPPTPPSRSVTAARGPHSRPFGQQLGSCLSLPERPASQQVLVLRYQQEPQRAERC